MKRLSLLSLLLILVLNFSCNEDDVASGSAKVNFSLTELVEVENTTNSLTINIGMDNPYHNGGMLSVEISGGIYGEDYETNTGSGTFQLEVEPNSLIANFSITPVDNEIFEENTILTIKLTNANGSLELGETTTMVFTILDNDDPTVSLVAFETEAAEVMENNSEGIPVVLLFDGETTQAGTVTVSLAGSAELGTDYTIDGQTGNSFVLEVPSGQTQTSFVLNPIDNTAFAANKQVELTLIEATDGLSLGALTESIVTIINDDESEFPLIDFSVATSTATEGNATLLVQFTLSEPLESDGIVEITASGTAVVGEDFSFAGNTNNPYTFTIPSGATSANLEVTIIDDPDLEIDETLFLAITNGSGGLIPGITLQQHTITIISDDQGIPINFLETFESFDGSPNYLNDVLGYDNVLANQTVDPSRIIELVYVPDGFANENDPTQPSDNGLNMYYSNLSDPNNNGVLDNVLISPLMEGSGNINVQMDVSYNFKTQNSALVTFYYSQIYDGSGVFNESEWTVIDTETANQMFNQGYGNDDYKREEFSIFATDFFRIAVRVTQEITDTKYRTRWRFDNLRVVSE